MEIFFFPSPRFTCKLFAMTPPLWEKLAGLLVIFIQRLVVCCLGSAQNFFLLTRWDPWLSFFLMLLSLMEAESCFPFPAVKEDFCPGTCCFNSPLRRFSGPCRRIPLTFLKCLPSFSLTASFVISISIDVFPFHLPPDGDRAVSLLFFLLNKRQRISLRCLPQRPDHLFALVGIRFAPLFLRWPQSGTPAFLRSVLRPSTEKIKD